MKVRKDIEEKKVKPRKEKVKLGKSLEKRETKYVPKYGGGLFGASSK